MLRGSVHIIYLQLYGSWLPIILSLYLLFVSSSLSLSFLGCFIHLQADWTTLVPEHEQDVMEWAACVHQNRLVLCYLQDVKVRRVSDYPQFQAFSIHKLCRSKHVKMGNMLPHTIIQTDQLKQGKPGIKAISKYCVHFSLTTVEPRLSEHLWAQ